MKIHAPTKDEVDPITMMLYRVHASLTPREIKTLTALSNVPSKSRFQIQDGLDLFLYLNDKDKVHREYLEMLLMSIKRPDLVENVKRFYINEWKTSSYAYTMEKIRETGEIPIVPRSSFKTVEVSHKHTFDVYIHYSDSDKVLADHVIKLLKSCGITICEGNFIDIWTEEPPKCRYCLPIISKAYLSQELEKELKIILDKEINPDASLKQIIPILRGMTPQYLAQQAPSLAPVVEFCYIAGAGEYAARATNIIRHGLKTSINRWYKARVTLDCSTKNQTGKNQAFEVRLSADDEFAIGRSENSILFRGDKGIRGLREGNQQGHCVISTSSSPSDKERCTVSLLSRGHPLSFISVSHETPLRLPYGTSMLLFGREWISIAGRRNAQQCQAKVKIRYSKGDDKLVLKVVAPKVREEVTFCSGVVVGSGEGSNLKIQVPGVDILKQHCKLVNTPQGWTLKSLSAAAYIFLQIPKEDCEPIVLSSGTEILVGTCTNIVVNVNEDIPDDEGIGMSETCSRMSGGSMLHKDHISVIDSDIS